MRRIPDTAFFVESGPVVITSAFLRHVHERLSGLAEALERQEASARRLVGDAWRDVDVADRNWSGPRSRKVITGASDYIAAIEPYAEAIAAGRRTVRRWARAALETADQLARVEQAAAEPSTTYEAVAWCGTERVGWCGTSTPDPIEEIRAEWRVRSRRLGSELDAATAAITTANAALVSNVASDDAVELLDQLGVQNLRGPEEVRHWWDRLTDGEQLALLTAYPGLLAGVDGLPPRIHTQARRTRAGEQVVRLEALDAAGDLTPQQERQLRETRAELAALGFDDDGRRVELVTATDFQPIAPVVPILP